MNLEDGPDHLVELNNGWRLTNARALAGLGIRLEGSRRLVFRWDSPRKLLLGLLGGSALLAVFLLPQLYGPDHPMTLGGRPVENTVVPLLAVTGVVALVLAFLERDAVAYEPATGRFVAGRGFLGRVQEQTLFHKRDVLALALDGKRYRDRTKRFAMTAEAMETWTYTLVALLANGTKRPLGLPARGDDGFYVASHVLGWLGRVLDFPIERGSPERTVKLVSTGIGSYTVVFEPVPWSPFE